MPFGQTIRIFLADATVTGIRHAEVMNWTGQAVACPRNRLPDLKNWDELQRPGAYFLFGIDENTETPAVYIGEAETVLTRMLEHAIGKDFWTEAIIFTNKDTNFTKAHAKYLEARLLELAAASKRYTVMNANRPQLCSLPRGDCDAMESFLEYARILLGVLGHKVLEPITPTTGFAAAPNENNDAVQSVRTGTVVRIDRSVKAEAVLTDEGLVVLAGSEASGQTSESLQRTYRHLREQLIADGTLAPSGTGFTFSKDHLFPRPSGAASVVLGYAINGRDAWKTAEGLTLAELESRAIPRQ